MLLWALFLATAIPTAVPVILVLGFDFTVQPTWIMATMGLLGMMHTGATGFFYTERRDMGRMVWMPLGFIALAAFVFSLDPAGFWPYLAVHYIWLLWHLGRQNFGLYALVAGGASDAERFYFDLVAVAAIPAAMTLYIPGALSPEVAVFLRILSYLLMAYAALIFLALSAYYVRMQWRTPGRYWIRRLSPFRRVVALFLGMAFWLPTVIGTHPALALTWFAHPIQYLVMVAWVSGRKSALDLAVAGGYAVGLWALLTGLQSAGALLVFSALAYGVTQAHFLIDGDVWKRGRAVV